MNKLWKSEAQNVLRNERNCVAVIDGDSPCLRAREFNDMVGGLAVKFFSGMFTLWRIFGWSQM